MSLLIDVRDADEYAAGHATGAFHVPIMAMVRGDESVFDTVGRDERVELYCHSGRRAERAREFLIAQGFTDVVNLGGLADIEKNNREKE